MEVEHVLEVKHLCKRYPTFHLKDVSFSIEKGSIMGFIGRNGAGKSTTLKALLNIVHPDSGNVSFFGLPYESNEKTIKNRIAFSAGAFDYSQNKSLNTITQVSRRFYSSWDEAIYKSYMTKFKLDERKTPAELSEGMKVKYSLCLALSHNAELLILDEPTSGLDPISREEVLEIFLSLADQGKTVLFSTHIISDLEKCADAITYIKNGEILASCSEQAFIDAYTLVHAKTREELDAYARANTSSEHSLGIRRNKRGFTALFKSSALQERTPIDGVSTSVPTLEEIMVHLESETEA